MGSSEYGGRRVIQKQNVDRISNLPDELLSHILSRLPAKWAFQTSILSKRWEKIWTSITCLVEAPNLEYLHLSESFITYNTEGNFSSLVKAYVNIGHISKRHDFKDFPRSFALPNFASLTCLDVFSCENRFWAMLPKFLRSTPSLEVLSIEQKDGHDNVIDDEYDWVEPKSVAKCVRHHIGVIKVEGFKGRKHELQLIKYFLGSAKVLKTLTVRCQGAKHEEEIKFVGKLLDFSRASKDCRVKFHGNVI